MVFSPKNNQWQKPFIVLFIFSHLIGCSKWKLIKPPIDRHVINEKPEWVEVESIFGEKFILNKPYIVNESLYGIRIKNNPTGFGTISDTISIGLDEIWRIKESKISIAGTGVSVLGGILIIGVIIFIIGLIAFFSNPPDFGI